MVAQQDGNFGASLATDLIFGVTCLSHRARVTKSSEILFQDSGITFPCRVGAKLFFEMGFLTYKKARTWWFEADDNFVLLVLQSSREKQEEEEYIVQKSLSSWYWASATHKNDLIFTVSRRRVPFEERGSTTEARCLHILTGKWPTVSL